MMGREPVVDPVPARPAALGAPAQQVIAATWCSSARAVSGSVP
jgi:hypothetical protein